MKKRLDEVLIIKIDRRMKAKLKEFSIRKDISMGEIIRKLLVNFLKGHSKGQ